MPNTNFLPSTHGFHFDNCFNQGTPDLIDLPILGETPIGDASNGQCGGMVYAALDYFFAQQAIPSRTDVPNLGDPLFTYISNRLFDSFGQHNFPPFADVLVFLEWMSYPNHEVTLSPIHGLAYRMIKEEWPKIKADIDNGKPCPLDLLAGDNPIGAADLSDKKQMLGNCHQVLAYAYDYDTASGNVTIHIYDPDHHDNNNSSFTFTTNDRGYHSFSITISQANRKFRAFFRSRSYSPKTPLTGSPLLPSISFVSPTPAANSSEQGIITLAAKAVQLPAIGFSIYYASNPADNKTISWHYMGRGVHQGNGIWTMSIDTKHIPNQGNAGLGTVNVCALALDQFGNPGSMQYRIYRLLNVQNPVPTGTHLTKAELITHTNDDNKNHNTGIYVEAKTTGGQLIANCANGDYSTGGNTEYKVNSDHTISLNIVNSSLTLEQCKNFKVHIWQRVPEANALFFHIPGHDTWKFNAKVVLTFSDGSVWYEEWNGISLVNDNASVEF